MRQAKEELKVITKSKELAGHTLKVTSNPKRFPKKFRYSLCARMQDKSLQIYETLMEANRTLLSNAALRSELQTKAILYCDELLFYIELSMSTLHILEPNSAEYWSKLVSDIKHMTIAWRTKDKER